MLCLERQRLAELCLDGRHMCSLPVDVLRLRVGSASLRRASAWLAFCLLSGTLMGVLTGCGSTPEPPPPPPQEAPPSLALVDLEPSPAPLPLGDPPLDAGELPPEGRSVVVHRPRGYVRTAPRHEARLLRVVYGNTWFLSDGVHRGWYRIRFGEGQAWIHSRDAAPVRRVLALPLHPRYLRTQEAYRTEGERARTLWLRVLVEDPHTPEMYNALRSLQAIQRQASGLSTAGRAAGGRAAGRQSLLPAIGSYLSDDALARARREGPSILEREAEMHLAQRRPAQAHQALIALYQLGPRPAAVSEGVLQAYLSEVAQDQRAVRLEQALGLAQALRSSLRVPPEYAGVTPEPPPPPAEEPPLPALPNASLDGTRRSGGLPSVEALTREAQAALRAGDVDRYRDRALLLIRSYPSSPRADQEAQALGAMQRVPPQMMEAADPSLLQGAVLIGEGWRLVREGRLQEVQQVLESLAQIATPHLDAYANLDGLLIRYLSALRDVSVPDRLLLARAQTIQTRLRPQLDIPPQLESIRS